MQVGIISEAGLFADGLAAMMMALGPFKIERANGPIREAVRNSDLEPGSLLIVDLQQTEEQDLDFLEGVQFLSNVRTIFIARDDESSTGELKNVISRNASAEDLREIVIREIDHLPSYSRSSKVRSEAVPGTKKRGRPRGMTNDLPLAPRQYEIARLIASGKSNSEVSQILDIQEQTVKNVMTTILKRLNLNHRRDLARVVLGTAS